MSDYETYEKEFKGHPLFCIVIGEFKGEKNEFSFGVNKAKAILACVEEIEAWVSEHTAGRPF